MNILMNNPVVPEKPPKGMLLHCGAELVNRNSLYEVPTPPGTRTWYPLSHTSVLNEIEVQLRACGFQITDEAHALSHNGDRYFAVLSVTLPNRNITDFGWAVGVRNSHDMTFPAGLVAGTRVFCCDNLAFSGEVRISRKHTRFAERDLRHLTARAVGKSMAATPWHQPNILLIRSLPLSCSAIPSDGLKYPIFRKNSAPPLRFSSLSGKRSVAGCSPVASFR